MEVHLEDHQVLLIDHRAALADHLILRTVLREVQDHLAVVQDHQVLLAVQAKDQQVEDKLINKNGTCPP